ncbi:helix-turn-helix transcriptional regulator [Alicyclobacillus sp. SO9]|uniref:helix-turn-helix domain-containing protein n=1 Tax=Alicyclobacillus sp. SO9 TaxID=2665646 RepID=UPI0018E8B540|nr:helix-turn-helix transcriptional regulator [Alicyclobacillus sp. SO9]QQE81612.1 helix-turn-helix transcriptional regulator [Alicyclobacillus sp. SO9]
MLGLMLRDPAARLRVLMAERDFTVKELSYSSGVSRATISALRNGHVKRPNRETAELLADALGVRLNSIWPKL